MRKQRLTTKLNPLLLSAIFSTFPILYAHANQCQNQTDTTNTVTVQSTCTSFSNSANITHNNTQGDDSNAIATGVLVEQDNNQLTSFTNTGTIKAEGQIGNVTLWLGFNGSYGFGVKIERNINSFKNSGTLEGIARGGNAGAGARMAVEGRAFYTPVGSGNTIDKIENTLTIKSEAHAGDAIGYAATVESFAGPYIDGDVSTFENSGSITNYAKGGSAKRNQNGDFSLFVNVRSQLSFNGNVDSFTNSGVISSKAEGGDIDVDSSRIFSLSAGVSIRGQVGQFTNSGTITGTAKAGEIKDGTEKVPNSSHQISVDASGVYIGAGVSGFENTNVGSIEAKAQVGDANGKESFVEGTARGFFLFGDMGSFKNSGTIKQEVKAGKAGGESSEVQTRAQVGIQGNITTLFENTGTISTNVEMGNAEGKNSKISTVAVEAISISGSVKEFKNSGSLEVNVNAGNAVGENSEIRLNTRGVWIYKQVENFTHQGNMRVDLRGGDASGSNSKVHVVDYLGGPGAIVGFDFIDKVKNFSTTGNIQVSAELGSAIGNGSQVRLSNVWGVRLNNGFDSATNNGDVQVNLKVGNNAQIASSGGYYIANANGSFENGQNGRIIVNIDAPNASSVDGVAGIFITSSPNLNSLSNSGEIRIVNNHPNASIAGIWIKDSTVNNLTNNAYIYFDNSAPETNVDIRTLRIEGNSNVTLGNKFSILFMQDNVYTFNRKLEPIYVGQGSTLNLNNSTLRVGIRNFSLVEFNKCYPIAKNEGTINGNWNTNIEKGYGNPAINVEWCDTNQRGADAQIVFRYYQQPQPPPPQEPPPQEPPPQEPPPQQPQPQPQPIIRNPSPELASPHMTFKMHPVRLTSLLIEYVYLERQIPDVLTETLPVLRFSKKTYLASLSPVKSYEADRFLFTIPFHTYTNAHSLGYRAYANGLILGFSPKPEGKLRYGIYGAYVDGYVKAKNFPAAEDLNTYAIGFYSSYLNKPYFLTFDLLGETTKHKYKGRTGFNFEIPETAKYWSRKYESKLVGGYLFSDSTWSIMPTIGVRAIHWSSNGYLTKPIIEEWATEVNPKSRTWISGILEITGAKVYRTEKFNTIFSGLLRVEHTLSDNKVIVDQGIPALNTGFVRFERDISRTTFLARGGVEFKKSNYTFGISGGVWINADYTTYDGRLTFKWEF